MTIVLCYVTLCSLFSSLRSLNYVSAHLYYRPNMGKDTVHLFASDTQFFFLFLIAIEGLPFEVNSKFEMLWKKSGVG